MLSTPPAFILSQDQTLIKSVCILQDDWLFQKLSVLKFTVFRFALTFVFALFSKNLFESFKVISLFNYQGSRPELFLSRSQLDYNITSVISCQQVFSTFSTFFNRERRRRDLNPRAAVNDLHPFQGCPFGQLGYFSTARIIGFI